MDGWIPPVLCLLLMMFAFAAAIWYLKQIRKGRTDPVVNPAWPDLMRPTSFDVTAPDPRGETSLFHDPDSPTNRPTGRTG
jgi:hypothetical protein